MSTYINTDWRKFQNQKYRARHRGIQFNFTFNEWMKLWLDSGHWSERGRHLNQYCMSRFEDKGNYEIGNVVIKLNKENLSEQAHPVGVKRPRRLKTNHKSK